MPNSHGRFVWYELMTTDVDKAKAFYAEVLGWNTRDASTSDLVYSLFAANDVPVAGVMRLPAEAATRGVPPNWLGYVGVDNVDAAVARARELGASVHVAPTDVPDVSRFSIIADPQTATLALVKGMKSGETPPAEPGAPGHVGWHELLAADWQKALAFYGALFGWQKTESHFGVMGTYQQFSAQGEEIGGMFDKPATLPFAFWLYYFNIEDIEATAGRVVANGGQILYGPTIVPGGAQIAHCIDPQGAVFALIDRRRKPLGFFFSDGAPRSAG
ncbi:MAG TPA: VOC family protein [Methylovirgula sp.]|nr:VOC family protein [Methylovirgula sp.]